MAGLIGRLRRPPERRLLDWGLPFLLALLLLGPLLLGRGYALVGDMVFVPDQPWKPRWVGADGSVPRAVPSDAVTWLLGTALPGDLVQKLLLLATVVLAGAGAAALTRTCSAPARAVAIVLMVWNPYVHERLAIGHWALLVGYAMLPWVAVGARRLRQGEPGAWRAVVWPLAVAAWTSPTGGVLAALVLLASVGPRPRVLLRTCALALAVNLPWLVPGVVNASSAPADPFGVQAFAARADSPWGVVGSVLGLGGIWKESVAVDVRGSALLSGLSVVLTLVALSGLLMLRRRDPASATPLLALAVLGFALVLLPVTGAGERVAEGLVTTIPGGGILRDSQKWVALALPGLCWGAAVAADAVGAWVRRRGGSATTLLLAAWAALPVLLLPTTAWGLSGTLSPHAYPAEWHEARSRLAAAGAADGRSVVLPFGLYRRFDWNGGHAVLDPAPRFFPGDVVTDDALAVTGGTVAGEDPLADEIRAAVDDPARLTQVLREAGVRWVIAHADGGEVDAVLPEGEPVHHGERLVVLELTGIHPRGEQRQEWLVALDLVVLVVIGAQLLPWERIRRYSRRRE